MWHLYVSNMTQASFLQKNQTIQNVFLISVTVRWHSSIKNHEIWTFQVNFLCQTFESYHFFFSLKSINLEPHFCKIHFLIISIKKHCILKWRPIFGNTVLSQRYRYQKNILQCLIFFVKMKLVSTMVHINTTTSICLLQGMS